MSYLIEALLDAAHQFIIGGITKAGTQVRLVSNHQGGDFKIFSPKQTCGTVFVIGSGSTRVNSNVLSAELNRAVDAGEAHETMFELLRLRNIQVSDLDKSVSKACLTTVTCRTPQEDGRTSKYQFFDWPREKRPNTPRIPQVLRGFDVTQLEEMFVELRDAGQPKPSSLESLRVAAGVDNTPIEDLFFDP